MSYDTLVFLAASHHSASHAAAKIPRERNLRRFFVFLGDKPPEEVLDWMSPQDLHITLERYIELDQSPIPAGVRAGVLYSGGWGLLFCLAENPPDETELQLAREAIQGANGIHKGYRVWGATREALVIHGFDAIYPSFLQNKDINKPASQTIDPNSVSDVELISAMQGHPVSQSAVIAGLRQVVHLRGMSLDQSALVLNEPYRDILTAILSQSSSTDDEFPTTLVVGSRIQADELYGALTKVPKHGLIIAIRDAYNSNIFNMIPDLNIMRKFLIKETDNTNIEVLVLHSLATK